MKTIIRDKLVSTRKRLFNELTVAIDAGDSFAVISLMRDCSAVERKLLRKGFQFAEQIPGV